MTSGCYAQAGEKGWKETASLTKKRIIEVEVEHFHLQTSHQHDTIPVRDLLP
jgi:hypothetical protein